MMAFMHRLIFIKSYVNRFTQVKKIEEILTDKRDSKDSHKKKTFSQIKKI